MDALSLLLSMANVTANSDVLVVDMVGGLLTGAVAERLGGLFYFHSLQIVNFSLFFLEYLLPYKFTPTEDADQHFPLLESIRV